MVLERTGCAHLAMAHGGGLEEADVRRENASGVAGQPWDVVVQCSMQPGALDSHT